MGEWMGAARVRPSPHPSPSDPCARRMGRQRRKVGASARAGVTGPSLGGCRNGRGGAGIDRPACRVDSVVALS